MSEKIRQQVLFTMEDLVLVNKWASETHAKNLNHAIHNLIEFKENIQRILKEKQELISAMEKKLSEQSEQIDNYRKLIIRGE
jgi:hypothetical protein